ncbi:hypothetical protein NA57DRAFT_51814 [Rhizodiscina lignyota]|uniref:RNA polymerase III RPC4-domain-containing protein n=1 Tax=Rhizodiscina lignyota TaxID=1504668 RepID=A0A9P4IV82_9PEZI|nr:hypothetical protein NA57DRAFT_51814 [Rhizodiscina lignyota]
MPPKRTRGGASKASNSRKAREPDSTAEEVVAQASAGAEDVSTDGRPQDEGETVGHEAAENPLQSEVARDKASASEANPTASQTGQTQDVLRNSHSGLSGSPSQSQRGKKALQPKFTTRRTKEERAAAARAEVNKEYERDKEWHLAEKRRLEREKRLKENNERSIAGGRGRGRGGFMGDHSRYSGPGQGAFSGGSLDTVPKTWSKHRKAGVHRPAYTYTKSGRPVKIEDGEGPGDMDRDGDMEMTGSRVKREEILISSDEDDAAQGPKRNIDLINLVSDDAMTESEGEDRMVPRKHGIAPVRIRRKTPPRKEDLNIKAIKKTPGAADEAEDDGTDDEPIVVEGPKKGKARARDVEVVQTTRRWRGVYDDEDEAKVQVKDEPMEDEVMAVDTLEEDEQGPQRAQKRKGKARTKSDLLFNKTEFQTEQEREEWDRHLDDLETLREELGTITIRSDADGDTDMTESRPARDQKADNVYLFQFPPILPDLILASEKVKHEQEQENTKMVNEHPEPVPVSNVKDKGKGKAKEKEVEKEKAKEVIKVEDDETDLSKEKEERAVKMPPGMVGKLRVHQSGKVTLDWGGTSLQVNMGLKATVFEDAAIVKPPLPGAVQGEAGEALGLGAVRGKFVVTPDFQELFKNA